MAFCFFAYAWVARPEVVRVDRDFVKLIGAFIVSLNFLKVLAMFFVMPRFYPEAWQNMMRIFYMIPPNHLLAVWWEDSFYVLPFLLLSRPVMNIRSTCLRFAAMSCSGVLFLLSIAHFTMGHLYQGPVGLTVAVYPVVSYVWGGRKGLGSILMLHILFDFTMYMPFWLGMTLLGM
jgi:hypothetical protein